MATGPVTQATAANFIPEIWMEAILDYAERFLGIRQLTTDAYSLALGNPGPLKMGDTLHVPRITEETAALKAPGTAVSFTAFTDPKTDVAIDQHSYVAKRIEDIAEIQANVSLLLQYVQAMVYGVDKGIESFVALLLQTATAHDINLTTDNQMTAAEFRTGEQNLMDEGYDIDRMKEMGDLYLYSDAAIKQYLKGLGTFTDYDKTGISPSATVTGMQQVVYGVPAKNSTDWDGDGTTGNEEATLFHRSAVLLAVQQEPVLELGRNLEQLSDEIVYSTIYGANLSHPAGDSTLPVANFNSP